MRKFLLAVLALAALAAWLILNQPSPHRIEPPLAPVVDPHYPIGTVTPEYPAPATVDPHYPPATPVNPEYGSRS